MRAGVAHPAPLSARVRRRRRQVEQRLAAGLNRPGPGWGLEEPGSGDGGSWRAGGVEVGLVVLESPGFTWRAPVEKLGLPVGPARKRRAGGFSDSRLPAAGFSV